MGTTLELLHLPMKLLEDVRRAVDESNSYKEECRKLGARVETLSRSLGSVFRRITDGNGCFCEHQTSRIMEDCTLTLEKCCVLLRRCKNTGILSRVIGINFATDFRRVSLSVDNACANVEWLLNVSNDEDTGVPGMPPILSSVPMLAVVWGMIAKIQAANPNVREAAASYLASLGEQHGQLIADEGGIPQLLKLLKDGTPEGQLLAATALGKLREYAPQITKDGGISAFSEILTDGSMQLQAKVAWALAEIVSNNQDMQKDFGSANVIRPLVTLMLETMDDLLPPLKPVSLQSVVKSSIVDRRYQIDLNGRVNNSGNTSSSHFVKDGTPDYGFVKEVEGKNEQFVSENVCASSSNSNESQTRNVTDTDYTGLTITRRHRKNQPLEVKNDLKTQVTRALWMLAQNNVANSRKITETKAMLGFAKLIELERGDLQWNSIMVVVALAESAEIDHGLRKFAFKPNSPAAKAVTGQLLKIINDPLGDSSVQQSCIKAVGCLARTFSAKEKRVIQCLVMKLSNICYSHPTVAAEVIDALLKFVDYDNHVRVENAQNIVEVSALPYLVQLALWDDHTVPIRAIALLCQLVLHVGHTSQLAFREVAALKVLKCVAASCSTFNRYVQFSIEDIVYTAIRHLEFCHGEEGCHPQRSHI